MEDFYMNITSQNNSYDYSNITSNYTNITYDYSNITSNYSNITYDDFDYSFYKNLFFIMYVVTCVIIGVGLLSTLIAIYALYSQVQNGHVAPIYIINLLISDIIQLCCLIIWVAPTHWKISSYFKCFYYPALVASVGFMVCVALERYLVVAHPLWYNFRRTIKISVGICVLVWVLALVFGLIYYFTYHAYTAFGIFLLLPLPLFIFFLGGTLKALSATRVASDEKRWIVAVLVLVLLIYTLLFLPNVILEMTWIARHNFDFTLLIVSEMFLRLSPLADLTLYVFTRKGTIDKLLSSVCCCRMDSDDTNSSSASMMTTFTQSASCRQRKREREKGEKTQGEM